MSMFGAYCAYATISDALHYLSGTPHSSHRQRSQESSLSDLETNPYGVSIQAWNRAKLFECWRR